MDKQNSKTVVINTFSNLGKEKLPTSTLAPTFRKNVEDIAMIDANAYFLAYQLKKAQVFAISIRDLEFHTEKEARPEKNPKTDIPKKYHDLLDVFSRKNLNILCPP